MFERFTDRARAVLVNAQDASIGFNHTWLGTEHILIGLLHAEGGVSATVLESFGVTEDAVRSKVVELVGESAPSEVSEEEALAALGIDLDQVRRRLEETFGEGALPAPDAAHPAFSVRAKQCLAQAKDEAIALGHTYIGTEHLLLGLLVDGTNVGLSVLHALDVDASVVRQRVLELVAPDQLRLRASERKLGRLAALTRDPEQSARHEEILAIYRVALREIAPARQAEVEARKAAVKTLADACESAVATAAKELTGLDLGLD